MNCLPDPLAKKKKNVKQQQQPTIKAVFYPARHWVSQLGVHTHSLSVHVTYKLGAEQWWLMPLMGGRSRRIFEYDASLVYRTISSVARDAQKNPVSKRKPINDKTWG